jgi:signal transduction histidine kinase
VTRVEGARVPMELEGVVCDIVGEAVRNALRHACPAALTVRISITAGCLVVSVVNDGVNRVDGGTGLGLGLRLAAAVAAEHGGRLEWGPVEESRWLVRLAIPLPGS